MPVMDGFTLCREWRLDGRLKDIPFVFYTATYTDPKDEQFALSLGADRFLIKPVEPQPFIQAIQEVLAKYQSGELIAHAGNPPDQAIYLKEYNETLIRKLEAKLEQLAEKDEDLEEASRRKDEFLAMLSHELRNPLAPICNSLEILRQSGPAPPRIQRQHERIERHVRHLARLVDDLLDVARITRGQIELRKRPLRLAEVIAHAVEMNAPLMASRHHTLHLPDPVESIHLEADPVRLAQAIGNLLANAAKFTPEGGQIWLDVGREGAEAVIRVRDNGIGITPEMLPHVFELFAQDKRGLDRSYGGLGIGLTLARKIVQMHGGTLDAHSGGLNKGSEFTIHLPLVPEKIPSIGCTA
jgi:signal transduction histidine kinase